ncbi:hypothetical protein RQN30_08605 [Arcanobacterium hippocoleae]
MWLLRALYAGIGAYVWASAGAALFARAQALLAGMKHSAEAVGVIGSVRGMSVRYCAWDAGASCGGLIVFCCVRCGERSRVGFLQLCLVYPSE